MSEEKSLTPEFWLKGTKPCTHAHLIGTDIKQMILFNTIKQERSQNFPARHVLYCVENLMDLSMKICGHAISFQMKCDKQRIKIRIYFNSVKTRNAAMTPIYLSTATNDIIRNAHGWHHLPITVPAHPNLITRFRLKNWLSICIIMSKYKGHWWSRPKMRLEPVHDNLWP